MTPEAIGWAALALLLLAVLVPGIRRGCCDLAQKRVAKEKKP